MLCVAPWALALHAWRHRGDERHEQYRRGALTTFIVTMALGGDNLAVWIPLLRARGAGRGSRRGRGLRRVGGGLRRERPCAVAGHPTVVAAGTRCGPTLVPWIYLGLGVLILVECHTLS